MPDVSVVLLIIANAALWLALNEIWESRDARTLC
jgi:hypothetical protein